MPWFSSCILARAGAAYPPAMNIFFVSLMAVFAPGSTKGCDLKLLLTWDVSPSMSPKEYELQRDGTARAILDASVQQAILAMPGGIAISIMQWAGPDDQQIALPWTMLLDEDDIANASLLVRSLEDPFDDFTGTAVGASLRFAGSYLPQGPDCARAVIDISADGGNNAGPSAGPEATALAAAGVTINAIVLPASDIAVQAEGDPRDFYAREIAVAAGSFVMDATSYEDYWRSLKMKLLRELPAAYALGHSLPRG